MDLPNVLVLDQTNQNGTVAFSLAYSMPKPRAMRQNWKKTKHETGQSLQYDWLEQKNTELCFPASGHDTKQCPSLVYDEPIVQNCRLPE